MCYIQVAENLSFWVSNSSWSYCQTCHQLLKEKLKPHFHKRPWTQHVISCKCTSEWYIVPRKDDIPEPLLMLSNGEIHTCNLLTSTMVTTAECHKVIARKWAISLSHNSVLQNIASIDDTDSRPRC